MAIWKEITTCSVPSTFSFFCMFTGTLRRRGSNGTFCTVQERVKKSKPVVVITSPLTPLNMSVAFSEARVVCSHLIFTFLFPFFEPFLPLYFLRKRGEKDKNKTKQKKFKTVEHCSVHPSTHYVASRIISILKWGCKSSIY